MPREPAEIGRDFFERVCASYGYTPNQIYTIIQSLESQPEFQREDGTTNVFPFLSKIVRVHDLVLTTIDFNRRKPDLELAIIAEYSGDLKFYEMPAVERYAAAVEYFRGLSERTGLPIININNPNTDWRRANLRAQVVLPQHIPGPKIIQPKTIEIMVVQPNPSPRDTLKRIVETIGELSSPIIKP